MNRDFVYSVPIDEFEFGVNRYAPIRGELFNDGSVMIWRGITVNQRTDLIVLPAPGMTAVQYVEEVFSLCRIIHSRILQPLLASF